MSMVASLVLLVSVFLILLVVGVHIGISLGLASAVYLFFVTGFDFSFIAQASVNYIDNFSLMAIPLFVLAGYMMEGTGLIGKLFEFFDSLSARMPAGVGVSSMFTCMVFAAITGSSAAEASAMSVVAIPEMRKKGYADDFSAGIVATGGSLGMLIPPSLTMILFGVIAEQNIPALFMAGMIPGITLGLLLSVAIVVWGKMRGYASASVVDWKRVAKTITAGFWALMLPVIVLGGLYGGVFTPTEAGAAACGYAIIYGLFSGRMKFVKKLPEMLHGTIGMSCMIFFILSGAGVFSLLLTVEQIPQAITAMVLETDLSWWQFFIIFNILLLIMGMFLDGVTLIVLTLPIAFPVACALDINAWHLAVVMTVNIGLAVCTPPVGLNLYVISGISKIPLEQVFRGALPFMILMFVFLMLLTFCPTISTFVPTSIWGNWTPPVW